MIFSARICSSKSLFSFSSFVLPVAIKIKKKFINQLLTRTFKFNVANDRSFCDKQHTSIEASIKTQTEAMYICVEYQKDGDRG